MDNGLKRLWSRKKSWGSSDQPARPRRLSSSNSTNIQSQSTLPTVKDGRPSMASSRHFESSYSRDRIGGSRDLTYVTSVDESIRSKSSHRIQPMLVGISRPETANARPGTSGSLQTTVQRAADSMEPRPSDVSRTHPPTTKAFTPGKPVSRHVDIFSVAAAVPSYRSRYNEDVAERNLDNYRLLLENTPYIYDPSSKYQEEVAIRNAYLPYKSRPSADTLRRPTDPSRNASMTSKSVRSVVSPQPNGSHSYNVSIDSTGSAQKMSQDQVNSYFRQFNQRSGPQLEAIPQEYGDRNELPQENVYTITATTTTTTTKSSHSTPRIVTLNNTIGRDGRMQTITEGQLYATQSLAAAKPPSRDSGHTSNNAIHDYTLSAVEHGNRPSANRAATVDRPLISQTNSEAMFGPPSTRSIASSIKRTIVLPNRTIMDLTNEDSSLISETSSTYNYSPIIEQAKSDAFQRINSSQIHTEERRGSREPASPAETPMSNVHPLWRETQTEEPLAYELQPDLKQHFSYAFSPINTVASWSPRSSTYVMNILNSTEPTTMTSKVTAALEANKAAVRDETRPVSIRLRGETPTVRERVASFETSAERSISPQMTVADTQVNGMQSKPVRAASTTTTSNTDATEKDEAKTPTMKAKDTVSYTPVIHTSPDSIASKDFVNPSSVFGVRTRDFALSPQTSTLPRSNETKPKASPQFTVKPVNSKMEGKARATKPRAKSSTPATTKPKDSGFDEEAFKRKQADARAALERLQRSLSEDFLTLPDRSTLKNSKGKEVDTDGRASAPTMIISQESKTNAPNISIPRVDTERPPPSSFRNSRGEQQQRASLNSNRSLSTGSRSSRRAPAPSTLKNVEPATNPINHNLLSPGLLQALQMGSNPPKSPGEISLSSFPVPSSSRPPSQPDVPTGFHSNTNSFVGIMKRRNSNKSQGSTASIFSIPLHMVPGRVSSVRDPVPEEVDSAWA